MKKDNNCKWLHEELEKLPLVKYPFDLNNLPRNGIYFFYEKGEIWGHNGSKPRIVRIGTHKEGNFRSRINEHFLLDERKMHFDRLKPSPKERSIFRKNIGRALLNKQKSEYLKIWEIDFTSRQDRDKFGHLRNIELEKEIENQITKILRRNFTFRFIIIENQIERMGSRGLESSLIGTVAKCEFCKPSNKWLGKFSSIEKIRESGLWQVQHLKVPGITNKEKIRIRNLIDRTLKQKL